MRKTKDCNVVSTSANICCRLHAVGCAEEFVFAVGALLNDYVGLLVSSNGINVSVRFALWSPVSTCYAELRPVNHDQSMCDLC